MPASARKQARQHVDPHRHRADRNAHQARGGPAAAERIDIGAEPGEMQQQRAPMTTTASMIIAIAVSRPPPGSRSAKSDDVE